MPSSPKLRKGFGIEGCIKVLGKRDVKYLREAEDNIHKPREIRVELECETGCRKDDIQTRIQLIAVIDLIYHHRKTFGYDELLEYAPENPLPA